MGFNTSLEVWKLSIETRYRLKEKQDTETKNKKRGKIPALIAF
ncbi:Hypothetical Protein CTN_0815 [Thermotoga neapolitana DSM 4359]|uniref:Uncharacterized protein n=1 Tax=Thermotoga neapolitana (strain ATCC 49049 / DSM 4359 / NBRC 107923 / NS-E) TaxID=309803 RepID=B9K7Q8_THENN|nr:Hypothetical Protein CTN_0815 [Thermotoga neapolitana DSM 4359]